MGCPLQLGRDRPESGLSTAECRSLELDHLMVAILRTQSSGCNLLWAVEQAVGVDCLSEAAEAKGQYPRILRNVKAVDWVALCQSSVE